ncbi:MULTISPECIES: PepSY domain-containing protein [unclassified Massilia]|uniref:PepSY-associated TM helix domain-containing protein n=1 Tax=unclassified Massilia TaxID=2609279 RepID=UPI00177C180A|nr:MULTISPECIES: PepSY domain-containing protein [unclassified Massilia]MBD8529790.1 PepSY domain-containing protein [Massilia sp. CFBP 13647]MBD8672198.1 PepSY domain-containing protein [Massilia sp. CFBP 13721]
MSSTPITAGPSTSGLYRRVWRWHFFAGLLCLPFIFSLALTGAVYLFNKELDDVMYRSLLIRDEAVVGTGAALPPGELIARAERAQGGVAKALQWPADTRHTVQVDVQQADGAVRQVFLDPSSGEVKGAMAESDRLMSLVKRIHSLTVAGNAGNVLIEVVAGWVIVLVLSGAYLWWPRGRKQGVLRIRPQAQGRVWWRDLHAVTGAFGAIVILFLALTGMPWSIVWGSQVNTWLTAHGLGVPDGTWTNLPQSGTPATALGAIPWSQEQQMLPASHAGHESGSSHHAGGATAMAQPPAPSAIGPDRAAAVFAAAGMKDVYRLVLPRGASGVYSAVRLRTAHASQRVIHLDQYSGKILMDLGPADVGAVARVTEWGVSVHQGTEYGLPNQLLMLAGCIALMLLCVSGVAVWWKRRPAGQLAAPVRRDADRLAAGVVVIAVVTGLVFPLLGASMALAALLDYAWSHSRALVLTARKS